MTLPATVQVTTPRSHCGVLRQMRASSGRSFGEKSYLGVFHWPVNWAGIWDGTA